MNQGETAGGPRPPRSRRGTLDSAFAPPVEEEEESSFSQWYKYTTEVILAGAPQLGRPLFGGDNEELQPEELLQCERMLPDEEQEQMPQQEQQQQQQRAVSSAIPTDGGRAPPVLQLPVHQEVAGIPSSLLKPLVSYRLADADDWQQLQQLHAEAFPFDYDDAFYSYICSGKGFALVASVQLEDIRRLRQQQEKQQQQQQEEQQGGEEEGTPILNGEPASAPSSACNNRRESATTAEAAATTADSDEGEQLPSSPHSWHAGTTNSHSRLIQYQQEQQDHPQELLVGVITVSQSSTYIRPEDSEAVRQWLEQKEQHLGEAAAAAAATADDVAAVKSSAKEAGDKPEDSPCAAAQREDAVPCRMHPAAEQQIMFNLPSLIAALSPDTSSPVTAAGEPPYNTCGGGSVPSAAHDGPPAGAHRTEAPAIGAPADGQSRGPPMRAPAPQSLLPSGLCPDPEVRDLAYVLTLAVAAPFRRHGVAADLLKHTVAFFRSVYNPAATAALYLHVADYNAAALSFYLKNGFTSISYIPSFYCINDKYYGSYLCSLHLHELCSCCRRSREQEAQKHQRAQEFIDRHAGGLVRGIEGLGRALKAVGKSVSAFLQTQDLVNEKQEAQM